MKLHLANGGTFTQPLPQRMQNEAFCCQHPPQAALGLQPEAQTQAVRMTGDWTQQRRMLLYSWRYHT
jgi:hypothetical protein